MAVTTALPTLAPRADRSSTVAGVIAAHGVRSVFQPIVDLTTRAVLGHEALARGPVGTAWESPAALFGGARAEGVLTELDEACRSSAFRAARDLGIRRPADGLRQRRARGPRPGLLRGPARGRRRSRRRPARGARDHRAGAGVPTGRAAAHRGPGPRARLGHRARRRRRRAGLADVHGPAGAGRRQARPLPGAAPGELRDGRGHERGQRLRGALGSRAARRGHRDRAAPAHGPGAGCDGGAGLDARTAHVGSGRERLRRCRCGFLPASPRATSGRRRPSPRSPPAPCCGIRRSGCSSR